MKEVKRKIVNEDNERQLYSLDATKVSKVNLPTFEGKDCEDFSKFKVNIEKGFITNRISREEQIIKLRECLKGYARKLVPDSNVTEIKEAWRILKQAFGNPIKIINHRKDALMKLCVKPKALANLNTEIAWYIDLTTLLREIINLGVKNPEYSELIFSNQFAMEIRQLFPHGRLKDKLRKCGGGGQTHLENMLERMNNWLKNAQINQQENDINDTSVIKEELHDYDETSGIKSDDKFNIVVKEDKILVSQETSDEELVKDNKAVLKNFKETKSRENDGQGSLDKEIDDQRSLLENDDQKDSNENDDQPWKIVRRILMINLEMKKLPMLVPHLQEYFLLMDVALLHPQEYFFLTDVDQMLEEGLTRSKILWRKYSI